MSAWTSLHSSSLLCMLLLYNYIAIYSYIQLGLYIDSSKSPSILLQLDSSSGSSKFPPSISAFAMSSNTSSILCSSVSSCRVHDQYCGLECMLHLHHSKFLVIYHHTKCCLHHFLSCVHSYGGKTWTWQPIDCSDRKINGHRDFVSNFLQLGSDHCHHFHPIPRQSTESSLTLLDRNGSSRASHDYPPL